MQLRLLFSFLLCASLTALFGQSPSVGIIGTATPTGWDSDTDLIQSATNPDEWTLTIALTAGECKFRQNDAWDVNWGAKDFPSGIGTQGGPNIPIPGAGLFDITFNSATGAYNFSVRSDIGIIGNATPGGWDNDTNMFQGAADTNVYTLTLNLIQGECKFRQNDAWTVNWGAVDFPTGVGTINGPNIPIPAAGKYSVTFNKSTGEYSFVEVLEYTTIGIIGSAAPYGWDADSSLVKSNSNPNLWSGVFDLVDGEAKFRANDAWSINWGNTGFPIDTGIINGPNIPVTAGRYLVSFNTSDFVYKFQEIVDYDRISIIGDAVGGWDKDIFMTQDPNDISIWKLRVILADGELKFRADSAWTINWGGGTFPTGIAEQDGANVPITAGEYIITFNSTTGAYDFKLLIIYSTVGLVGPATPLASWDTDVDMTKDLADETFWYINSIDLTDGEVKFRAEDAWAVNWGLAQWPSGVGTQDGPNIPVTAGTYRVTLKTGTGEYSFSEPTSTIDLLRSDVVKLSPNPVADQLTINVTAAELQGEARVILFNSLGQQVLSQNINLQGAAVVNVAELVPGQYLVHLTNGKYIVGKQVVIAH